MELGRWRRVEMMIWAPASCTRRWENGGSGERMEDGRGNGVSVEWRSGVQLTQGWRGNARARGGTLHVHDSPPPFLGRHPSSPARTAIHLATSTCHSHLHLFFFILQPDSRLIWETRACTTRLLVPGTPPMPRKETQKMSLR